MGLEFCLWKSFRLQFVFMWGDSDFLFLLEEAVVAYIVQRFGPVHLESELLQELLLVVCSSL